MTTRAPRVPVAHLTNPSYSAGNSDHGDAWAIAHGYVWTDNDVLASKAVAGVRTLMNGHYPMLRHDGHVPWRDRRRYSDLTAAQLAKLRTPQGFRIRTVLESLDNAHRLGLRRELEAKTLITAAEWRGVAEHARSLWGDDWRQYVVVKCLTTTFRWRRILRNAHAAGFTTIALVRGPWRYRAINSPSITYVRGSKRKALR